MGVRTLSEFRTNLSYGLGNRGVADGGNIPASTLTSWINSAYIKITSKDRLSSGKKLVFPELEATDSSQSTADGTPTLSVPSNCLVLKHIYDYTNDAALSYIDWLTYLGYADRYDAAAENVPDEWTRYGALIYLHPTPASIYNIYFYYRKRPSLLSADADKLAVGAEWDDIVEKQAIIDSLIRLKRYEEAKAEKSELTEMMDELVDIYLQEQKSRDMRIVPNMYALRNPY